MIVALDLETSWLDPLNDKIIEIALIKFNPKTFEIIEEFSTLINPQIEIPEIVTNITNISNDDVLDSPKWFEVYNKVIDFIWECPILWHNVYFDKDFLINNLVDIKDNITIDTFLFVNSLSLEIKSLSLEYLSSYFKIELNWAHRAFNDTMATIKVFQELLSILSNLDKNQSYFFDFIVSKSEDSGFKFIKDNYFSFKDKTDLSKLILKIKNKIISDWIELTKKIVNKKVNPSKVEKYLFWINSLEKRDNQLKMIEIVTDSFSKWKFSCIEAPTWLWKTFSYLLPSILHSLKTGEQVYISTMTKTLQDQIFKKDLKFLEENLWLSFVYSKLKWKSNYIWLSTFFDFIWDNKLFSKEKTSFSIKILFWLLRSKFWELDELDYYWQEYNFLKEVNADNPITFDSKNEYEELEFAVRARRQSRKSNIVIINNNILFQDLEWDNNILWNLKNLIVDECHNLEDVITSSFKKSFCFYDIEKSFSNIEKILEKYSKHIDNYEKNKSSIIFNIWTIFDLFNSYLSEKVSLDSKYKNILINKDFLSKYQEVKNIFKDLNITIIDMLDSMSILEDKIYLSLSRDIEFFELVIDVLSKLTDQDSIENYIAMISYNDKFGIYLEYTLLRPGSYLKENLFDKLSVCIFTSATLKINDSFEYIKNILSIEDFDFYSLDSDFDYSKQALLFIPNDLWSIKNNIENLNLFLYDFIKVVWWKTLILFTSFQNIKDSYLNLSHKIKNKKINLYAQSIMWWKHKLLDSFKSDSKNSVLMWTDSFWQWIDISWEDLKYLIIHKIPFMVPSDPIFQARTRLFNDSFLEYSIPKSIIKLKQWFWRLIRDKKDSWIVVFLDDRIFSTKWGEYFYWAFPSNINKKIWKSSSLINILKTQK